MLLNILIGWSLCIILVMAASARWQNRMSKYDSNSV